ncbi:hypothetical protein Hanom_Chr05g00419471 [Helianthus anomalus]
MLLTIALAAGAGAGVSRSSIVTDENDIEFGNPMWFVYDEVSWLMSLGVVELEILHRSGSNREKKQAGSCFCNYMEDCVVEVREKEPSLGNRWFSVEMVVVLWLGYCINGGDDVGSLMMREDGFCRGRMMDCVEDMDVGKDIVRSKRAKREEKRREGWGWGGQVGKMTKILLTKLRKRTKKPVFLEI